MSIEFGRSFAGHRGAVARVRGGSAGAISGAVSVAAHGWASGGMSLDSTTLALLVAAAALVGALVAGLAPLRETSVGLITALVAGQLLGHLTMGFGSGHLHHGDAQLTPAMLGAHVVAAILAALVIRGTETAYRTGTAVLFRVLRSYRPAPIRADPASLRTAYRDRVILRVFAAESLRTRGPPFAVAS
ncbi:hypothetical protein [Nocardia sp. NPDC057030]|uniref:hypothetical protein n=1 Tax=unclassified Nocardia TaxID=2637762 RepID=UPI00363CF8BE